MKPIATVLAVAAAAILASASPADAASCSLVGKTVVIKLAFPSDVVSLNRGPNGAIYDGGSPWPPGATVNTTDAIFIRDTTPSRDGDGFVGIDLSSVPLGTCCSIKGTVATSEIPVLLF